MKALKFIINGEEQEIPQGWWVKSITIDISSYTSDTRTLTATINAPWSVNDLVDGTYIWGNINTSIWASGAERIIINWEEFNIVWSDLSYKGSADNIIARIIGWEFWILEVFNNTQAN